MNDAEKAKERLQTATMAVGICEIGILIVATSLWGWLGLGSCIFLVGLVTLLSVRVRAKR